MPVVLAVDWYHFIGDDPVFHFVTFRVKIRVSSDGGVAVEVSHYDPFSPSGWMVWRRLPSNINLIPRTSVSSSTDLWVSAAGSMFFTRIRSSPLGLLSLSLLKVSKPLTEKRWLGLR